MLRQINKGTIFFVGAVFVILMMIVMLEVVAKYQKSQEVLGARDVRLK